MLALRGKSTIFHFVRDYIWLFIQLLPYSPMEIVVVTERDQLLKYFVL